MAAVLASDVSSSHFRGVEPVLPPCLLMKVRRASCSWTAMSVESKLRLAIDHRNDNVRASSPSTPNPQVVRDSTTLPERTLANLGHRSCPN